MATVSVSVTLKKQSVPANPQASPTIRFQLVQDGIVKMITTCLLPGTSALFSNVSDGTYTIVAQRMNQGVAPVGPIGAAATSEPFTVVNTVDIDVPDLINVTF